MVTMRQDSTLLDVKAAIRFLKTSRPTFYRWLRSGRLKGLKVGRQWRFPRADLERFARGQAPRIEAPVGLDPLLEALGATGGEGGSRVEVASGVVIDTAETLPRLARAIVDRALERGAYDVHLMPQRGEHGAVVGALAYRRGEALERAAVFERSLLEPVPDQFKVLAGRDLHERSRPQVGRIDAWVVPGGTRRVDLSLCFVPTVLGEALTVRVHDPRSVKIMLDQLPFLAGDRLRMERAVKLPHGLVLLTGPTGSGKTTTLYAYVQERMKAAIKVMTVEDPVEALLDGALQVPVNKAAGLTAAVALRAVIASDPDVIVIMEMADAEVAALAVHAAATGHLVVAQLQATDAAAAIDRMAELGVDRSALADALRLVTNQRLVGNLCTACRRAVPVERAEAKRLAELARAGGLPWKRAPLTYYQPRGCEACDWKGFAGKTMLSEVIEMVPALGRAVRARAHASEFRKLAVLEGMPTLVADGLAKAVAGVTTVDEVLRVTAR